MATETLLDAVEATGAGSSFSMGKFTNEAQSKGSCKSLSASASETYNPRKASVEETKKTLQHHSHLHRKAKDEH